MPEKAKNEIIYSSPSPSICVNVVSSGRMTELMPWNLNAYVLVSCSYQDI